MKYEKPSSKCVRVVLKIVIFYIVAQEIAIVERNMRKIYFHSPVAQYIFGLDCQENHIKKTFLDLNKTKLCWFSLFLRFV